MFHPLRPRYSSLHGGCIGAALLQLDCSGRGGAGVQQLDWRGHGAGAKGAGRYFIGAAIVKLCRGIVVVGGTSLLPVGWGTTGGGAKDRQGAKDFGR